MGKGFDRLVAHRVAFVIQIDLRCEGHLRDIVDVDQFDAPRGDDHEIPHAGQIRNMAGMGNLVIVPSGVIKLVDINNIAQVAFTPEIDLDDKGYPVCDKSIEALAHLEAKLLGNTIDPTERMYRFFLNPERMRRVSEKERLFYRDFKFR